MTFLCRVTSSPRPHQAIVSYTIRDQLHISKTTNSSQEKCFSGLSPHINAYICQKYDENWFIRPNDCCHFWRFHFCVCYTIGVAKKDDVMSIMAYELQLFHKLSVVWTVLVEMGLWRFYLSLTLSGIKIV